MKILQIIQIKDDKKSFEVIMKEIEKMEDEDFDLEKFKNQIKSIIH